MNQGVQDRLQAKTPERRFLQVLEHEFHYAPKVAEAILAEAQSCLLGQPGELRPGQVRVILTCSDAGPGRAVRDSPTTEVVWTLDAGLEDQQVLQRHGRTALRQVRLQRLLDEAVEQGAVATQEDVARCLQVSVRTVKRDCAVLQHQDVDLPTRGNLCGIGRGQTHKARIVGQWLSEADLSAILNLSLTRIAELLAEARQTTGKSLVTKGYVFDQGVRPTHKAETIALYEAGLDEVTIARRVGHAQSSVGHYIRDYERVKLLLVHHTSVSHIPQLTGMTPSVVQAHVRLVCRYHPDLTPEGMSPPAT